MDDAFRVLSCLLKRVHEFLSYIREQGDHTLAHARVVLGLG